MFKKAPRTNNNYVATLNFARGKFNNVPERARGETVIFTTDDTDNRDGYNAHEDWSIAIDMQIARIISTLNVRCQRERGIREVWPLQEEDFKGCHVHSTATKRRRRPHNRWSSVIKMKNYALLRLSPSRPPSPHGSKRLHLRHGQLRVRPIRLSREKVPGKERAKWNSSSTTRRIYK